MGCLTNVRQPLKTARNERFLAVLRLRAGFERERGLKAGPFHTIPAEFWCFSFINILARQPLFSGTGQEHKLYDNSFLPVHSS